MQALQILVRSLAGEVLLVTAVLASAGLVVEYVADQIKVSGHFENPGSIMESVSGGLSLMQLDTFTASDDWSVHSGSLRPACLDPQRYVFQSSR